MEAYLDNSATTRPTAPVIEAMISSMKHGFFNPSSLYRPALEAQKAMDACRALLALEAGAPRESVTFTSGGTEANHLAIVGHLRGHRKPGRVLFSAVEHPAVREACLAAADYGHQVVMIPVAADGTVDIAAFEQLLTPDVLLICVMQVNNETGAIQPIPQIAKLRDKLCPAATIHVDGVQGFLRVPFSMKAGGVQSYAISGHKIGAPKGIGALIHMKSHRLLPLQPGGGQELGLRSGTENTPGIAGLLCAVETFPKDAPTRMTAMKALLWRLLSEGIPALCRISPDEDSSCDSPHILCAAFPPVRGETLLHSLEGEGVYVSTGSACSSKKLKLSHTLSAMGIDRRTAECVLRFSLAPSTTEEEIRYAAKAAAQHYELLSTYRRR